MTQINADAYYVILRKSAISVGNNKMKNKARRLRR
jgi:hypothetical protein